ncbi:MAG: PilZ domain-containing protein [Thermodesulfobacteriota bacterium]|nr:PilZ domain-containing protein [Thermodesulfobacteriota bacterium]
MTDSFQESRTSSVKSKLEKLAQGISMIIEDGSEEERQRLFILLQSRRVLTFLETWERRERRRDPRHSCSISVTCATEDHVFEDSFGNISTGGAFVETSEALSPGEDMTLTFSSPDLETPIKIKGKVVWRTSQGIGVKFTTASKDLQAMILSL